LHRNHGQGLAKGSKLLFLGTRLAAILLLLHLLQLVPLANIAAPLPNAACPYRNRPAAPWQHVFPDRLQLSALTELETAYSPSWRATDLDRLVSSCRRLQKLSLCCTPGLQLTALLQLNNLWQLWLRRAPDHKSTMTSLAQLSGLRKLRRLGVTDASTGCSDGLFMPLTALTQLTYLALATR